MKKTEFVLLAAIFLDLIGFGMAFPDVQLRAQEFGADGITIGAILASFFAVQFVVSPHWGSLSDRIGRKPVIVACTALSAVSMLVYAAATNVWVILASRLLGGFAAANVVVAQAYISDVTTEKERVGAIGRIGAAVSAGLISGPAIGGFLAHAGGNRLMGLSAALCSAVAALMLLAFLPGRPPTAERAPGRRPIFEYRLLRELPRLRRYFVLAVVSWFALACLEGTFGRLINLKLGYDQREFGLIFSFESVVAVVVQGVLLKRLATRVSQTVMLRVGYFLQGLGLSLTPFAPGLAVLFVVGGLYSMGIGLANPTVNAICSDLTPESRQGELFGLLQGARSVGFLLGPILGGRLFDWKPEAPYLLAGVVGLAAAALVPSKSSSSERTVSESL